ncbi:unnamed protein product [Closterium sp. Naga37s-1]|nr:unnamed protein product [Closterium sp. Naga37s-1]
MTHKCQADTETYVEPRNAGSALHEQRQSFMDMWQRIGVEPAEPLVCLGVEPRTTGGRSAEEEKLKPGLGAEEKEEEGERGLFVFSPRTDLPGSPSAGPSAPPSVPSASPSTPTSPHSAPSPPPFAPARPPIPTGTPLLSVPLRATLWVPLHATSAGAGGRGSGSPVQRLAIALLQAVCGERDGGMGAGEGERKGEAVGMEGSGEKQIEVEEEETSFETSQQMAGGIWRQYAEELLPREIEARVQTLVDWSEEDLEHLQSPPTAAETLADWSDEELEHLQSPPAAAEVRAYAAEMAAMEAAVAAAVPGAGRERARWALRVVTSRSFSISHATDPAGSAGATGAAGAAEAAGAVKPAEPTEGTGAAEFRGAAVDSPLRGGGGGLVDLPSSFQVLVPLVDMANHACSAATDSHAAVQPSATWRIRRGRTQGFASTPSPPRFELLASRPLRPGAQVTISYGPLTSLAFLLSFGFLPHSNPANRITIYSHSEKMMDDVEERVTRLQHKRHLLSQMTSEDAPLLAYTGGLAVKLMECLLVLHASSADELAHLDHHWTASRSLTAANVSPRTRSVAAKQLVDRCRELLKDYPTTLPADEAQLEQLKGGAASDERSRQSEGSEGGEVGEHEQEGKSRRRMQAAVGYRLEEKRILADAIARYGRMVVVV